MQKRLFSGNRLTPFGPRVAMAGGGPNPRWGEEDWSDWSQAGRGRRGGRRGRRVQDIERFAGAHWMRGGPGGPRRGRPGFGGSGFGGPEFGGPEFGGPEFGGPFFAGPRGRGRRRRRRGDVRTALLLLLAEEPRNGYQLMQTIEERSDGNWRPSPGSVYPVLSQLEDEGLVHVAEREGSRVFELTGAGRERAAQAEGARAPWEADDDDRVSGRRDMRRLVREIAAAAMQVSQLGDEQQVAQAIDTMKNARRTLYQILADREDV